MILYELAKHFKERAKLHEAFKQTTDEPVASDLLIQIDNLNEQLKMRAEELQSGILRESYVASMNPDIYLDEG